MSLRVLFSHSYHLRLDPKQLRAGRPYPPLATLYAMAAARAAGHQVVVHDATFKTPEDFTAALEGTRPDAVVFYDDGFNYLTKMCLSNMQAAAWSMIAAAKRRGLPVLVAGSDATDHRRGYLERGADAVLLGDGEGTTCEWLDRIEAGEDAAGVIGLARLAGGELIESGRRETPADLDTLLPPAWDTIDLAPYEHTWRRRYREWSLNLVSSRGCPYGCSWCAKPIFGRQYVVHSPERMAGELQELRRRHRFDHVWFCDDIFGLTPEWCEGFAGAVADARLRLRFLIQTRADLILRDTIRRPLVAAGLETAWLGVESGSQKILDAMNKGIRLEQTYQAVRALRRDGVRVGLFLQFGYLGEDAEDIAATHRMVRDLVPDEIGVSVSYPLPGTPFYDLVRDRMTGKSNWTDSDDLDLMFPGRYPAAFYRRLHRYTHRLLGCHRALRGLRLLATRPARLHRADLRALAALPTNAVSAVVDAWRLRALARP